ncbi:MAG: hypothetical protein ABSH20_12435 [Tepidisphaeraceae bacterium]
MYKLATIFIVALAAAVSVRAAESGFIDAVRVAREKLAAAAPADRAALADEAAWPFRRDFALEFDWVLQDSAMAFGPWLGKSADAETLRRMLERAAGQCAKPQPLLADLGKLAQDKVAGNDVRWLELYLRACQVRRAERLAWLATRCPRVVFTRHANMGGSHYAYTEAQSDAQAERNFVPGAALCTLEIADGKVHIRTLIDDKKGVIRDPAVSYDGRRVLFSWKKSDREDDYHLYEMDAATEKVRQITSGLGVADYEGAYLPSGDIVFNSTRCVQIVDCWWTEVSNLYTCAADGRFLRRLTFDQVHTNYPTVMDDGRVVYTRWEYNDRGQVFPQPLYQMNPDGTNQSEFYGNNSWFPTTIIHARGLPGSGRVMAILTGHHSYQAGKLAIIDPARGTQENQGVQLIAPVRPTKAERIDAYGQEGELFQHPYPLSDTQFLVSYTPTGWNDRKRGRAQTRFGIYLMSIDGQRELLAADPEISCNQPIPLMERTRPAVVASPVDYRKETGTFYIHDVYAGPGLAGIERGTIKRVRVVSMEFRAAGIGENGSGGPAGGALSSTPPSINNGAWDPKIVLGDAKVHDDGSAFFEVPARTPVYFQCLDDKGRAVQTMRSWSTLQPGETASCVGCHEEKTAISYAARGVTQAARAGVQKLEPPFGSVRGFSYPRDIQPILDRHCIECHDDRSQQWDRHQPVPATSVAPLAAGARPKAFSLLGETTIDAKSKRYWSDSYLALTQRGHSNRMVAWIGAQSVPTMLPPKFSGSTQSGLLLLLERGHYDVKLSREEYERIACWIDLLIPYCGDYTEAAAWTEKEKAKYQHFLDKRRRLADEDKENIKALLAT